MYYRVKAYQSSYRNMIVLDSDSNLSKLKQRNRIEDCAITQPRTFSNPVLMEKQEVFCISSNRSITTSIIQDSITQV